MTIPVKVHINMSCGYKKIYCIKFKLPWAHSQTKAVLQTSLQNAGKRKHRKCLSMDLLKQFYKQVCKMQERGKD